MCTEISEESACNRELGTLQLSPSLTYRIRGWIYDLIETGIILIINFYKSINQDLLVVDPHPHILLSVASDHKLIELLENVKLQEMLDFIALLNIFCYIRKN